MKTQEIVQNNESYTQFGNVSNDEYNDIHNDDIDSFNNGTLNLYFKDISKLSNLQLSDKQQMEIWQKADKNWLNDVSPIIKKLQIKLDLKSDNSQNISISLKKYAFRNGNPFREQKLVRDLKIVKNSESLLTQYDVSIIKTSWEKYMKEINPIIQNTYKYVIYLSRIYCNKYTFDSNSHLPEIISSGNIGLFKAIPNYDYKKRTKLSTYATYYIKKEITEYIRKYIFELSRAEWEHYGKILQFLSENKTKINVNELTEKSETLKALAKKLKTPVEECLKMNHQLFEQLTLNNIEIIEIIEATQNEYNINVEKEIDRKKVKQLLNKTIDLLPNLQRIVMMKHYYNDMSVTEISIQLDKNVSPISRLLKRAKEFIKQTIKSNPEIEDFVNDWLY